MKPVLYLLDRPVAQLALAQAYLLLLQRRGLAAPVPKRVKKLKQLPLLEEAANAVR